ncbi:MAG TPA: cyclic dehypoxanthinyl futalosine synthase [Candidatus Gastranaerophilales bacterium]|nr:cyclic dehypoxanthinyl futalosine synthase [Candidatus Gastranaerophilales bacterium]
MTKLQLKLNNIVEIATLLESPDLLNIGALANQKRCEIHPEETPVTFVIDRNVNYTNICSCKCRFCLFNRNKEDKDAYILDYETIKKKTEELVSAGGTQLLLQGGLNQDLPLEYYTNFLIKLRKDFPNLAIHAFSPAEIVFIAENNNLSVKELLEEFVKSGLSSIPGGGAELLCDDIRHKLSPNKICSKKWLDVMETAHNIGLKTTATMVFGFGESAGHIAEHLLKIRQLQEKTGGFTAFIPWTFVPAGNFYGLSNNINNTAFDYLKVLAISRLVLDNIPNIQVSWVTQGLKIAQIALGFGANDFGGTMLEENVVKAAGISNNTCVQEIITNIQKAGFQAAQRDTYYKIIKTF